MQLIVLGMHRSGTSTVARLLNMMGAYFGPADVMMPVTQANLKGFWERTDVVALHDKVLAELGLSWDNLHGFEPGLIDTEIRHRYMPQVRKIFLDLDAHRPWQIKDPRMCLLLPLWRPLLEVPVYIYVYRDPLEIARSLASREHHFVHYPGAPLNPIQNAGFTAGEAHFPLGLGLALWERYTLGALHDTQDAPKLLVSYHALLERPVETLRALHRGLLEYDVGNLRMPSDKEILAFIDPGLHRAHADTALRNGTLNRQQEALRAAFEDGSLLRMEILPALSNSAVEALEAHRDRLSAAHKVDEYATRLAQLQAQEAQFTEQTQRLTRYQEIVDKALHALTEKELLLQTQQGEQQEYARQLEEKDQFIQHQQNLFSANLKQALELAHVLETDIESIFNSLTWRSGTFLTRLALALTFRTPGRTAQDHIDEVRLRLADFTAQQDNVLAGGTLHATGRSSATGPASLAAALTARHDPRDYSVWRKKYATPDSKTLKAMQQIIEGWSNPPLISLMMPVYNTAAEHLRAAIDSVCRQAYPHWELCIADDASTTPHVAQILTEYQAREPRIKVCFRKENGHISAATNSALELAEGTFTGFLDHDDLLAPDALFWIAREILQAPDALLIYSDEDKLDAKSKRCDPHFKPEWSPDLLLSYNYINHFAVYRTESVRELGGLREGFEGAQDYDLVLRVVAGSKPEQIRHIPRVLYHWRITESSTAGQETQKPYALRAAQRAIGEYLAQLGRAAEVSAASELVGANRVRYALPAAPPLVTIIIPTRNGLNLLQTCLDSIAAKTDYPNYEILIIDNNSDDPATLLYFDDLVENGRARVEPYPHPFNYAAINNMAVEHARGDVLCLMNNDIEVLTPDWLSEMTGHALRPEVGAVGARLWYPNETLQHGGVIVGLGGVAGHSHKYFRRGDLGYFGRTVVIQNFSAVTAACMVLRKEVYEQSGGMEAEHLQVAFNDVDFCLKIGELGLFIVWTPYAELYHHESISRGHENTPEKIVRFQRECAYMKSRWQDMLQNDPAYSPNLTLNTEDFAYAWPPRVQGLDGLGRKPAWDSLLAPLRKRPKAVPKRIAPAKLAPGKTDKTRPQAEMLPPHLQHRSAAYRLLHGKGIEIGAFNQPTRLPPECRMTYCDVAKRDELARRFPEVHADTLVETVQICDLDTRDLPFAEGSLDFVVLSHVLQQCANPLKALQRAFKVLKAGGHLLLSVPDKRFNFERYRATTELEHVLTEYRENVEQNSDEHYLELLRVAHPGVFNLSPEELADAVANCRRRRENAHAWDSRAFRKTLQSACAELQIDVEEVFVSDGDDNRFEYCTVLKLPARD